jgi:hypothetical protein
MLRGWISEKIAMDLHCIKTSSHQCAVMQKKFARSLNDRRWMKSAKRWDSRKHGDLSDDYTKL